MDGVLKKKGISLSMQYLNEMPLAQIKGIEMGHFIFIVSYLNKMLN